MSNPARQRTRRSRDGCWTCKRRRKKCDSTVFPCGNCQRLGLECETETRLVWEDDKRRDGMRRRGPAKASKANARTQTSVKEVIIPQYEQPETAVALRRDHNPPSSTAFPPAAQSPPGWEIVGLRHPSAWPFDLDQTEFQLLSHYAQRFSRVYPAFGGPTNPFLQVFLPLSMQSRPVLDAVLALSSVQSWENGSFSMETQMLRLRHQALRGCHELISRVMSRSNGQGAIQEAIQEAPSFEDAIQTVAHRTDLSTGDNDVIHLLATCGLLLLYEKLSGEKGENGTSHLQFFARLFPAQKLLRLTNEASSAGAGHDGWKEAVHFLSSLFLYNDIVRSTSFRTPTLLNFCPDDMGSSGSYIEESDTETGGLCRFEFPSMMARISSGDLTVTDEEIAAWDGRLDWFPSFALLPPEKVEPHERLPTANSAFVYNPFYRRLDSFTCPENWTERMLISELYRVAATVYRKQCLQGADVQLADDLGMMGQETGMGNLPLWAIELIRTLPHDSLFQSTLLWPTAIVAKELTAQHDREYISERLQSLEHTFKMKHFCVVREHLTRHWAMRDMGLHYEEEQPALFG